MGFKSRGNWSTGACFRKCANRDLKCDDCIAFGEFKPLTDDSVADEENNKCKTKEKNSTYS
jgi:hypothetical protein